jgi:hypothetical protein
MWHESGVHANPAIESEAAAVRAAFGDAPLVPEPGVGDIERWTVTVGDVCFAVLGQITNRAYEAVRGQGTSCVVVTSPVHDPRIAKAVRAQWEGPDARTRLARRLADDLFTTPQDDGIAGGAAMRLQYYFPVVADRLVAARLEAMVSAATGESATGRTEAYEAARLLDAALERPGPLVRAVWLSLLRPETPPDLLVEALGVSAEFLDDAARSRLREIAAAAVRPLDFLRVVSLLPEMSDAATLARLEGFLIPPYEKYSGDRTGPETLAVVLQRFPEDAPRVYAAHTERHGLLGRIDVLLALWGTRDGKALALLAPLLSVREEIPDWRVHVSSHGAALVRVCDFAAVIVSEIRADLPFDPSADLATRDRRVSEIQAALDAPPAK